MKIYTKTGDSGETSLYDGSRAPKYSINFDVLGEMDELSSRIGVLCAHLNGKTRMISGLDILNMLRHIQRNLQDFNSYIATIDKKGKRLPELDEKIILMLEDKIDNLEDMNPKLTRFILPGVTLADAQAHMCRTQARKAERVLTQLHNSNELLTITKHGERVELELEQFVIPEIILKYMNRLSDFFFVLARWLCHVQARKDCFV